jgi:hypothetical protein
MQAVSYKVMCKLTAELLRNFEAVSKIVELCSFTLAGELALLLARGHLRTFDIM